MSNPPKQPNKTKKSGLDLIAAKPPETAASDAASDAAFEKEIRDLDLEMRKVLLEETRGTIQDRQKYANKIYRVVATWIWLIFGLLVAQGLGQYTHFKLSDSVLLAAIGSTTANVIGMLLIVLRFLFPSEKTKNKSTQV